MIDILFLVFFGKIESKCNLFVIMIMLTFNEHYDK